MVKNTLTVKSLRRQQLSSILFEFQVLFNRAYGSATLIHDDEISISFFLNFTVVGDLEPKGSY